MRLAVGEPVLSRVQRILDTSLRSKTIRSYPMRCGHPLVQCTFVAQQVCCTLNQLETLSQCRYRKIHAES